MASYHVFTDVRMPQHLPVGAVLVPQRTYTAERPVQAFDAAAPIRFVTRGALGIRLVDALEENTFALEGAGEMIQIPSRGQKLGIRMVWPGYEPWTKHISIVGVAPNQLITKGRLAYEVARAVRKCLEELSHKSSSEAAPDWWATQVPIDQLVLLELHQVMLSSWQPILCRVVPVPALGA
ncbi:hypothetical protein PsYK624_090770 [Phanerochaete sordida]|uniref:Uncharacterized protein n=1 Tax=Phanerochaete sordida TaxID=48140 RepID=A0A9P3GDJ3_9APHY|nr:hypothetical protein PsYK624_090770 [Phanerochaete sordida]